MANRVTATEVRSIANIEDSSYDVTLFIEQANLLVEEELLATGLSEQRLRVIELNLAAHFAILSYEHGGLLSQEVGESKETYKGANADINQRFSTTRFGQQALALDTSGTLQRMNSVTGQAIIRMQ